MPPTSNGYCRQNDQTYHVADIRESGSVAHIYGQNFVAAESLIENFDATFRVDGKTPELWFAETCKTEALSYSIVNPITTVKLQLPNNSL